MDIQSKPMIQPSSLTHTQSTQPSNAPITNAEPKLLQGREMIMELGASVLGRQNIERWEQQGLELNYAAYEEAFNTLNQAMRWSQEQGQASLTSHSFNAYGIVANAQSVPDWFIAEGERSHAQERRPDVRQAFQQGESWFGHIRSIRA